MNVSNDFSLHGSDLHEFMLSARTESGSCRALPAAVYILFWLLRGCTDT